MRTFIFSVDHLESSRMVLRRMKSIFTTRFGNKLWVTRCDVILLVISSSLAGEIIMKDLFIPLWFQKYMLFLWQTLSFKIIWILYVAQSRNNSSPFLAEWVSAYVSINQSINQSINHVFRAFIEEFLSKNCLFWHANESTNNSIDYCLPD